MQLSRALAGLGHAVDLFATEPGPTATLNDGGLRITRFSRGWPDRVGRSAPLRMALDHSEAEIFHHHSLWLRTLHYVHRRAARSGVFVLSPRGAMAEWSWNRHRCRKRIASALIHPGAFSSVDGWHATSAEEESEIRALGFIQPICVAPNGVAAPTELERDEARRYWIGRCPAVESRPVAVFYSRFHPKKRVLELIDLWLATGPNDWLLLLVGIPEDYTPEMLDRYVDRQSGTGRIAAFSGVDCPAPYAVASLFLLPSHNENFGLVVAEALAHGVPALVTDTTPWKELNIPGRGWCVPWSDYAAALRAATAEPAGQLAERGAGCRTWALGAFSWRHSAERLARFYGLLQERRGERA